MPDLHKFQVALIRQSEEESQKEKTKRKKTNYPTAIAHLKRKAKKNPQHSPLIYLCISPSHSATHSRTSCPPLTHSSLGGLQGRVATTAHFSWFDNHSLVLSVAPTDCTIIVTAPPPPRPISDNIFRTNTP